jgi:predicted nucleic acid-binding protein
MKKTHRTREQFVTIMHQLKEIITVIPKEEYSKFVIEAETFSPDPKDTMYFALAMKLNAAIWSNDDRLMKQDQIKIYKTSDLMELI